MATETLNEKALEADIYNAVPTEKVDGTCCYVTTYKGNKGDQYTSFSCWLVACFSCNTKVIVTISILKCP